MAVCGPVAGDDVDSVHQWLRGTGGVYGNLLDVHRSIAKCNGFPVGRPHRVALVPALGQAGADPASQVVGPDKVLAVVLVIRIDGQRSTIRRELGALITDLGELTEFLSCGIVPN